MFVTFDFHCNKKHQFVFILSCASIVTIWITANTDLAISKRILIVKNAIYPVVFNKKDGLPENNWPTWEKSPELGDSLNATLILILAYYRGGSTLTGDMFNNNPAAMYVFEPLRSLQILTRAVKPLQFLDSHYTYPKTQDDISNISVNTLRDIFTCRFDMLDVAALSQHHLTLSRTTGKYGRCVRTISQSNHAKIRACIKPFREACLGSSVRSIKTIRLSMKEAGILMKELPNLKIIHLIRDPRGFLPSRVSLKAFDWSNVDKESKAACGVIEKDVRDSAHLHNIYPDRIITILYERIAEDPLTAQKEIYKFSNLPLDPFSVQWLIKSTMSGNERQCTYCSTKANSTATAYSWRHKLSFKIVKAIDENCKMLYEKLGYRAIDLEKDLSNMSYPSRV